jgi:hypothetical protein
MSFEGPNLFYDISIPAGTYVLSLNFFNKDGHTGKNPRRDYPLFIRNRPTAEFGTSGSNLPPQPILARGRVRDFWGSVYKKFLVQGPAQITVEIDKAWSLNTEISAAMLDALDERPAPYFPNERGGQAMASPAAEKPAAAINPPGTFPTTVPIAVSTQAVFESLEAMRQENPYAWALCRRQMYREILLSAARLESPSRRPAVAGTCYYQIGLFEQWENEQRESNLMPARDIEKALRWNGKDDHFGGFETVANFMANAARENPDHEHR